MSPAPVRSARAGMICLALVCAAPWLVPAIVGVTIAEAMGWLLR